LRSAVGVTVARPTISAEMTGRAFVGSSASTGRQDCASASSSARCWRSPKT